MRLGSETGVNFVDGQGAIYGFSVYVVYVFVSLLTKKIYQGW